MAMRYRIYVTICSLRLWNKLCILDDSRICKRVFNWEHSICRANWCFEMKKLFRLVDGNDNVFINKLVVNIHSYTLLLDDLEREA